MLKGVVSDGIIAPGYEPEALEILKAKKKGAFIVLAGRPRVRAAARETPRAVRHAPGAGPQRASSSPSSELADVLGGALTPAAKRDLLLG